MFLHSIKLIAKVGLFVLYLLQVHV